MKFKTNLIILILATVVATLSWNSVPHQFLADALGPMELENIVPKSMGDWKMLETNNALLFIGGQESLSDKIYSNTLERTYVNRAGYRIMLTIAYGKDQTDTLALHYPEVCYPAQGFKVLSNSSHTINEQQHSIATKRVLTQYENRVEPVTYWTLLGEFVYQGNTQRKLNQMKYGLQGYIPDGMLIRISSIDADVSSAFKVQDSFIRDFIKSIPMLNKNRFVGKQVKHRE